MAAPAYPAPPKLHLRKLLAAALLLFVGNVHAVTWTAISQEDLQRKTPEMDQNAAAEILLNESILDHSYHSGYRSEYHLVVKIYSDRGLDQFSRVEIPYKTGTYIKDIEARVVKADGTSQELKAKDIYDREVLKAGNVRAKVKSFAPPGLEVGSVLEYRYTEIGNEFSTLLVVLFQSEQPARLVRVKVKMPSILIPGLFIRSIMSNCPNMPLETDKHGFYTFERSNVPAAKEEPLQPAKFNTDMAMLLYFTEERNVPPAEFWKKHSKFLFKETESKARVTRLVKSKLAEIISPTDSAEVKLRKIFDYCRTKIVHRDRDTTQASESQRAKWANNEDASDVLKHGSGGTEDINLAFVALARAAGFDARIAACNDRDFIAFAWQVADRFMLSDSAAAVLVDSKWTYCAPGATYVPFGALPWWNSDTAVLVGDKAGDQELKLVLGLSASESLFTRKATLSIDADGLLEGDVIETYTGLYEARMKHELDARTPSERADYVKDVLQQHQKLAEVSDVKVENAADPLNPISISYHLRIPEYADRTGSRIFLQPAVFQKGMPPLFRESERRTNITFPFRYTTVDDIRIKLPEGYALEQPSGLGALDFGLLGAYDTKLRYKKASAELFLTRNLQIKGIQFPPKVYPVIKAAFEEISKRDAHTLTLKRSETPAPPPDSLTKTTTSVTAETAL